MVCEPRRPCKEPRPLQEELVSLPLPETWDSVELEIGVGIPSKMQMGKEMEVYKTKNEVSIPSQKRFYKMQELVS